MLLPLCAFGSEVIAYDQDYIEALDYLNKAQSSIEQYDQLPSKEPNPQEQREAFTRYISLTHKAIPALKRSADQNNAASQYLLAIAFRLPLTAEHDRNRMCDLFIKSAVLGFTPAALALMGSCTEAIEPDQVSNLLKVALSSEQKYRNYYPAPALTYRLCTPNSPSALSLPLLSQAEFEAEAYYALGRATRGSENTALMNKLAFHEAAVKRGCKPAEAVTESLREHVKKINGEHGS